MRTRVIEPTTEQILRFCAAAPIERVFLEDVALRRQGRFAALGDKGGELTALCHLGSNLVPSGVGCHAFAGLAAKSGARMLIGESDAVTDLWEAVRRKLPRPRLDRPGQPVYTISEMPEAGRTGLRPATATDLDLLVPACAAAHLEEIAVDPLRRDPSGFRWRTLAQIDEGRSWLWVESGVIRFKAEASAWTGAAVQLQQRQSLLSAQDLVAARGEALAYHQPGVGRPDVDQVQRRGLAPALVSPAQRLAIDRHDTLQLAGEGGGELREGRLERLRLQEPEHPAEGVMARRTMRQLHHLPQHPELRLRELRHVGAVFRSAQHRRQRHEHQLQKIVPGVTRSGIGNPSEVV